MAEQIYDEIPISDAGKALVGTICGREIRLAWTLTTEGIEGLELAIFRLGRPADRIPLTARGTAGETVSQTVTFDERTDVAAMVILVQKGGEWRRLAHDPNGFFLDRLLSLDLVQVNGNLRWFRRFKDLETRFFAARNSIANTPGNFEVHARCLVAVGYGAIETDSATIAFWALDYCRENAGVLVNEPDTELRNSVVNLWLHLAIWSEDLATFQEITSLVAGGFLDKNIENHALATYNALCSILLIAGFLFETGAKEKADKVLAPHDKYFKIAAKGFPRALVNFYEMTQIGQRSYICRVGICHIRGLIDQLQIAENPQFSAAVAWINGHRLRDIEASKKMLEKYLRLIEREGLRQTESVTREGRTASVFEARTQK